jgi:hypothetical protein
MKNKKINEGPVSPTSTKKATTTSSTSSSSWLDPMTRMVDKAKKDAEKPVSKWDQGMPGGNDPTDLTGSSIGDAAIPAAFIYSILSVLGAATIAIIAKSRRSRGLLKSLAKKLEKNPAAAAKLASQLDKNTEKVMNLVDRRISRMASRPESERTVGRRLNKALTYEAKLRSDPMEMANYMRRLNILKEPEYDALIELLRSSGDAKLEVVKATTRIAYNKYKQGKWKWERAELWLAHLDDVKSGYVEKLKQQADAFKIKPKTSILQSKKLSRAITKQELNTWANTPIGRQLAPGYTSGLKATVSPVKLHNADLTQFAIAAKKYPVLAAAFYDKTKEQFYKLTTQSPKASWDTWLIHDGWDTYKEIAKTSRLPSSFKSISEWPSFTDWQMAMRVHNLHPNLWKDAAAMQKQYLKDKFLWLMSK